MSTHPTPAMRSAPAWMSAVLWLAAVYNVLWAATTMAVPNLVFEQIGMTPPSPIEFWLGISALVGVFGVGYGLAATAPYKHWAVVTIGLLSKLMGVVGMAVAIGKKTLPVEFGYLSVVNDAIWLLPFALILRGAWRAYHPKATPAPAGRATTAATHVRAGPAGGADPAATPGDSESASYHAAEAAAVATATRQATLHRGHMLSALSLRELADKTPTLVVFLRHLGCPFCRETLATIAKNRKSIESRGVAIVLVHMSPAPKAADFFSRYGLDTPEPVWHVSDPERRLYATFELARTTIGRTLGPRELARGFKVSIIDRRLFAIPQGDARQLGGAFLFYRRRILKAFRSQRPSDRIDCTDVASCDFEPTITAVEPPAAPLPASTAPKAAPRSGR